MYRNNYLIQMYGMDIERNLNIACSKSCNISVDDFIKLDLEVKMNNYANELIADTLEVFQIFSKDILDHGWVYDIISSRKFVLEKNSINYPCSFLNFQFYLEGQKFVIENLIKISENKEYTDLLKFLNRNFVDIKDETEFFSNLLINFVDLIKNDQEISYYFAFLDTLAFIFFRCAGVVSLEILKNREIFHNFDKVEYFLNKISLMSNHINMNTKALNKDLLPYVLNDLDGFLSDEKKINICELHLNNIINNSKNK
ncbi:hypothetical protein [Campylobacter sp. MG1]|uniref:hypothetical protein n=1 Tax=Campylobacter sp. MG1 TaxID=2976332 RepID=UPI00226D1C50|nr:hypothetical protein [Campylobacter sp. MG1]